MPGYERRNKKVFRRCLETGSDGAEVVWWQLVPQVGADDWKWPFADGAAADERCYQAASRSRSKPVSAGHVSDASEIRREVTWCTFRVVRFRLTWPQIARCVKLGSKFVLNFFVLPCMSTRSGSKDQRWRHVTIIGNSIHTSEYAVQGGSK